jgi:hypothetical protein
VREVICFVNVDTRSYALANRNPGNSMALDVMGVGGDRIWPALFLQVDPGILVRGGM